MIKLKLIFICLAVFILTGCSVLDPLHPSPQESLIRGYSTQCRSDVFIKDKEELSSSLTVPAGEQRLIVEARSEPEQPEKYFGEDVYLCQEFSEHELSFSSKGGRTYRLHLDKSGPERYTISVWEGVDRYAIETLPVKSESVQKKLSRHCRFFYECNQMFGE